MCHLFNFSLFHVVLICLVLILETTSYNTYKRKENDSDYGYSMNLRAVSNMAPVRSGRCRKRSKDGRLACLPDVISLGPSKTGSSSVAHYFLSHPMIANLKPPKGSNEGTVVLSCHLYYCHLRRNPVVYLTLFPQGHFLDVDGLDNRKMAKAVLKRIFTQQFGLNTTVHEQTRPLVVDYTPNYFILDEVPRFMSEYFPHKEKLKFIICFRDPVKRAVSSWVAKTVKGSQAIPSFSESISLGMKQGDCITECFKLESRGLNITDFQNSPIMKKCSITACRKRHDSVSGSAGGRSALAHVVKSMYAYQLRLWYEYFHPSQFHIFTLEQFVANPILQMERMFDFLGLPLYDTTGLQGFRNREELTNLLSFTRNVTPKRPDVLKEVTDKLRAKLSEYFKPHNKLLVQILGWDPGYAL